MSELSVLIVEDDADFRASVAALVAARRISDP